MNKTYSRGLPFIMWALPVLFFSYQFALRIWPGLMMNEILAQLQISASEFGLINSAYYYGYGGMQIPVAIMLDKWGPRRTISLLVLLCGLSNLIFSYTSHWMVAAACRFLVGVGSAVGFLGVSKVVSQWFAKKDYGRMIGISVAIGVMGAVYGGAPLRMLVDTFSMGNVSLVVSGIAVMLALGIYALMRFQPPYGASQEPFKISYLKTVLSSPLLWLLGLANFLLVGPLEGFADVWGVSYLTTAYGISKETATHLASSCIFLGLICGGPFIPLLGQKIGDYTVTLICGMGIVLGFAWLLSGATYNFYDFIGMFLVIGVCCGYQINLLSAGTNLVQTALAGITVAFLNSMNMFGGSFFHTVIGSIMDYKWTGLVSSDGTKVYSVGAYQYALSTIPLAALVGTLLVAFVVIKWKAAIKSKAVLIKSKI